MIIDYDHNPAATIEQKLQSLRESIQLALNEKADIDLPGITKLSEILTKARQNSAPVMGIYEVTGISLAADTYLGQKIPLGRKKGRTPILAGYDILGTNTSQAHVMGQYIFEEDDEYKAYIKMRSGASALSGVTVRAYVAWL